MIILIKGMEMPTGDTNITLSLYPDGKVVVCGRPLVHYEAVPIPPHGRLIDADALTDSFRESVKECHTWADEISNLAGTEADMYARVSQSLGTFVEAVLRTKAAPTIIPAEGVNE